MGRGDPLKEYDTESLTMARCFKTKVRKQVRSLRSGLAEPDSVRLCQALEEFLAERVPFQKYIVIFDAMPGEADLAQLIDAHLDPGSRFAGTRTPSVGFELTVHPVGGPTKPHRYGFEQPLKTSPQIRDARIGAVLVPAMAFDIAGRRLGRGKGYYDRFLARLDPGVLRIGITGDFVADVVPTEEHDVTMTHLASSFGVHAVPAPDELVTHHLGDFTH